MHKSIIRFAATFIVSAAIPATALAVIDIGSRKQLFIDEKFIEHGRGVDLHINPCSKYGVVLAGDNSWENGMVQDAVSIIEDGGKYRMWYTACPASGPELAPFRLCYAESTDGINWVKPNLGLYEWEGSKANNIIMDSNIENGAGVFIDQKGRPNERYKLLARLSEKKVFGLGKDPVVPNAPNGSGLYMYTSADGLKWDLHPTRVFPFVPDTANMAFYDDRAGKYRAYVRTWNPLRRVGVVDMDYIMQPWPYEKMPPRLWPGRPTDTPAPSREIPEAFGPGPGDPENVDFYTSAVVRYRWADDVYFMFPSAYRHFPEPPVGKFRNDGLLDIQLAVSRDGLKFHRVSRLPYVELGMKGSGDSGSMYMCIGMIRRGNEIYQYYGGYDFTHGNYVGLPVIRNLGGVRLTRQRLDGFVSVDAAENGGEFVTPPVTFQGSQLTLNLNASATGEVHVELRESDGRPIAGYTFGESDSIGQNDVARVVTWRGGNADVGSLAGREVRIAFKLCSVKLYAFQFKD